VNLEYSDEKAALIKKLKGYTSQWRVDDHRSERPSIAGPGYKKKTDKLIVELIAEPERCPLTNRWPLIEIGPI